MRIPVLPVCALALAASAHGQVSRFVGPSPNLTTALDFDNPAAPPGPIATNSPVFTSVGIASINLVGTWIVGTDTLTTGSNVYGQSLVSQGGSTMTVAGPGAALDNPAAGAGFDIVLASMVDEFQCIFADQVNHNYSVQLFSGGTSLGTGAFNYAHANFPAPPHYWRANAPFNRIRITFPAAIASGVGIDELAFGNGPPPTPPANDECAGAQVVGLGATVYDTNGATTSATAFSCIAAGSDVWFSHTASNSGGLQFSTCNATNDTVLEVYTGACGGLTSVACNDDTCGVGLLRARVTLPNAVAGTTYFIRLGGFGSTLGTGTLVIEEVDPTPPNCVVTSFNGGNQGNVGGNVYFDLTVTQNVTLSGVMTNFTAAAGTQVGIVVWTTPTTYVGNEANQAVWTQAATDNGNATAAGWYSATDITFAAPLVLSAGTYGICLQAIGSAQAYTNGNGPNQVAMSANGVLSLALGAATNAPFTGTPFTPRVWNGQLCADVTGLGTNYCTAVPNSTGNTGSISATGSAIRANNDVTLQASSLPNNSFGFFLTSRTQGFVANPGGSMGNLCLGSPIGRYVGPGQIKNTGLLGAFTLVLNLGQTPTPTGLVSINAGETWNFQSWHRDAVGGAATSNFTDGLSINFL